MRDGRSATLRLPAANITAKGNLMQIKGAEASAKPGAINDCSGSKPVNLEVSKCVPVCPRKRTYLPILDLLPPPALGERGHGGLARRLVAVRRRPVLMLAKGLGPVVATRGVVLRARRGHSLFRLRVKLIGIGLH